MAEYTPMMRQYFDIKEQHQDEILFYRLGDFYEMFYDDAVTASKVLDLVLTGRDCGQTERAPMCGIPFHSAEAYIARLVDGGYKVAICEQTGEVTPGKGLVQRDVVRIISKGTIIEDSMLDGGKSNYISAVYMGELGGGVCFCDMSTGEATATSCSGKDFTAQLVEELARFSPSEVLLCEQAGANGKLCGIIKDKLGITAYNSSGSLFELGTATDCVNHQFVGSADSLDEYETRAVGGLIGYLHETQKKDLSYINKLQVYTTDSYMHLDISAKRNLEILESLSGRGKKGTLLDTLDYTKTAMGARLIRKWLVNPLINPVQIENRLNAVKGFLQCVIDRDTFSGLIKGVYDIERIISRVAYGTANGKDLIALAAVCKKLPHIKGVLSNIPSKLLLSLSLDIDILGDMLELITNGITEEPPFSLREGGIIRTGFNEQVDYFRGLMENKSKQLLQIEQHEREVTGIKTLKVGYNRVFGYYIELTKGVSHLAPPNYVRKQTLSNCERYIIDELKVLEGDILSASDKLVALEYELFCTIRQTVADNFSRFQKTAQAIACADVLCSFAVAAERNSYTMPLVDTATRLEIIDGRHPVVETLLDGQMFVPNDTCLDTDDNRVAIITGPNMAGKSTYMKQTAIIVVMAQCGSFVPARSAKIGICDKVFTRVGASDDLAGGRSTFMVEMSEVADILKQATKNSLLILDEIGRGTSTYDGMSIARGVLEYVADKKLLGAKTMFATHYHELTALEDILQGVKNYNIVVKKRGDDIVFIKKIVPGGADDSYGVEVAKLAGLPDRVISRAKSILAELEGGSTSQAPIKASRVDAQLSLEQSIEAEVALELRKITPEVLTPIEALNILNILCKKVKSI